MFTTLIFSQFCSNDFPETWLWYVLSQYELILEIFQKVVQLNANNIENIFLQFNRI